MKIFLVVLMWLGLGLLYFIISAVLRGMMGMSAMHGVITAVIGVGLWYLGHKWSRQIRK